MVAAADDARRRRGRCRRCSRRPRFRVYSHADVVGVELAGALKNVIAIAAGILEGLGLGNNPRAALITRGLAEITRLGVAMGADPLTFAGLAGMGDLILTTTGALSRNRALGMALAQGQTLAEYTATHRTRGGGRQHGPGGAGAGGRGTASNCRSARRWPASCSRASRAAAGGGGPDGTDPQVGAVAVTMARPVQEFFSIGEVCALTDLKPHVLRYWESQFRFLNPAKNRSGNRVYKSREVELIMLVKHLLYTEKYTIEGARQRIEHYRRTGELRGAARAAIERETLRELREAVEEIADILDGKTPPSRREPAAE